MKFLQDLIGTVVLRGRALLDGAGLAAAPAAGLTPEELRRMAGALLSRRGEASGVAMARDLMARYGASDQPGRAALLRTLADDFRPSPKRIAEAYERYAASGADRELQALIAAVEPPRQELIRRLNLAPGNTLALVRMRADLLDLLPDHPELTGLDDDFRHLFGSWFNRGFLVVRRIDWSTPAHILEKIIRYEAVHAIESWDDLRGRLQPPDRRCYGFFHPALVDEPLIFVEVALTRGVPDAIQPILAQDRPAIAATDAETAAFYSISNCQRGLAGISFGSFLIKQVVEELRRDLPNLTTFVTLSPVPGLAEWAAGGAGPANGDAADWPDDKLGELAADYLLNGRTPRGRPLDPVARFHLGNGASLHRINAGADLSVKGRRESFGVMVNYLYDLAAIEQNHEAFAESGAIAASASVRRLASRRHADRTASA